MLPGRHYQRAMSQPSLKDRIEAYLERFLDSKTAELRDAEALVALVRGVVRSGGKRIRPSFCYWGYRAAGADDDDRIVAAAASLELLHTFAIVHDDIMDRSDTRRGIPAVHAAHGDAVGILVGDLALTFADASFVGSGFEGREMQRGLAAYLQMRERVIAGQYRDLTAPADITLDHALEIAASKSGNYSVLEPFQIGSLLAGGELQPPSFADEFGHAVGVAFQLRDDILGLFGDPEVTGKSNDADVREGKRHALYALTLAALGPAERAVFVRRWGAPDLSPGEVDDLRRSVESSGARATAEEMLVGLAQRARSALERLDASDEVREALGDLATSVVDRNA